jgi:DNA-binding NarL/FixJ family response regulator
MLEQGKILIVDNDETFLQTTKIVLEQEGHACTIASDIKAVTGLLEDKEYDLLIMDIGFPSLQQVEIFSEVQTQLRNVPLIAVTGQPTLESAMRAIQLQVMAYLVKPFDISLLLTEARKAITRTELVKVAAKIQKQWCERYESFRAATAGMSAATSIPNFSSLNLMVMTVLEDLARSFENLQKLHAFLGLQEGESPFRKIASESANLAASLNSPPEPGTSSTPLSLHGRGKQGQEQDRPAEVLRQIQLLSPRERDVLRLLLANQKPKTIAQTLFLSSHTVRNHLRSIFEKLSVHSQTELLTLLGRYSTYMDLQEAV